MLKENSFISFIILTLFAIVTFLSFNIYNNGITSETAILNTFFYAVLVYISAANLNIMGGIFFAILSIGLSSYLIHQFIDIKNFDRNILSILIGQGTLFFSVACIKGKSSKLKNAIENYDTELTNYKNKYLAIDNKMKNYVADLAEKKINVVAEGLSYYTKILKASKLSKEFSSTYDLDEIYKTTLKATKSLLSAESCALFLRDGTKELMNLLESDSWERLKTGVSTIKFGEGLLGWVIENKTYINRVSIEKDINLKELMSLEKFPLEIAAPLLYKDEIIGLLIVGNFAKPPQTDDDWEFIFGFTSIITSLSAISIENAKNYKKVQEMAITDGLTKIYNHRFFQEMLSKALEDNKKKNRCVSVVLIDIDFFKRFNDDYGHQVGDTALISTAKILKDSLRPMDFAARYGGEEFVIVLNDSSVEMAYETAERLRKAVESNKFVEPGGTNLNVTGSMGVATFPEHGTNNEELIKCADIALYKAKETGRNRVVIYDSMLSNAD